MTDAVAPVQPGEPGDSFDILRRSFIAIATADYTDDTCGSLPGVTGEVKQLTKWLCSPQLGHRRFAPVAETLQANPTKRQIEDALTECDWNHDDAAVVFVTGHGIVHAHTHWIVLHPTQTARLQRTGALRTSDLVDWLRETDVEHLLVILDMCYAGAAAADTVKLPSFPDSWLVLASALNDQTATTGALTSAITGLLELLDTPAGAKYGDQPYLSVDDFLREVKARLPAGQRLATLDRALPRSGPSPCLPNPRYQPLPQLVEQPRRDLGIRQDDLDAHWAPKAAGSKTGWLFTGRAHLVTHLITALTGPGTAVVVTGGAGTGKSAVLGRLVTLSDPLFCTTHPDLVAAVPPQLRPPLGSVDIAVLATGKLPHEVLAQLVDATAAPHLGGRRPSGPEMEELRTTWSTWLHARTEPVTVVIDAIDEAKNPELLLTEVLTQLATTSDRNKLRLIVGVRSPGGPDDPTAPPTPGTAPGRALADRLVDALAARRVAVDQQPWWDDQDLVDYATEILTTTAGSPYQHPTHTSSHDGDSTTDGRSAQALARELAPRSRKSFLITRLEATRIAAGNTRIDPTDPAWHHVLDEGVLGVFRRDLHQIRPDPEDRLRAVHLLRAVAFAYGRGLPWSQIWPLAANAIADRPGTYGDHDIVGLLTSRLGGYLITDQEDGVTVYRLFHDALRATLRNQWRSLLDPPDQT